MYVVSITPLICVKCTALRCTALRCTALRCTALRFLNALFLSHEFYLFLLTNEYNRIRDSEKAHF
jgi:hypothetical protein